MRRAKAIGVGAATLLALAGCADRDRQGADGSICAPFNSAGASGTGAPGGEAALDDCLHRTAYRLARAGDGADIVAQATVAACGESLSRWNTSTVQSSAPGTAGVSDQAVDLITGQTATQLAQRYAYAQGRALYFVVQGRADRCDVPPPATGRT